jgi:hypothetical protein
MFAKLFESQKYGQILVKIDSASDDDMAEVRFFFQPKDLGVCSCAICFEGSDAGWGLAEKAFEKADLAFAESIVSTAGGQLPGLVNF